MGYYIETPPLNKNKADALLVAFPDKVKEVPHAPKFDATGKTVAVCVVDNGPFEAAAIAYSPSELAAFSCDPSDTRPKRWLTMPREIVVGLNPAVEPRLPKVSA